MGHPYLMLPLSSSPTHHHHTHHSHTLILYLSLSLPTSLSSARLSQPQLHDRIPPPAQPAHPASPPRFAQKGFIYHLTRISHRKTLPPTPHPKKDALLHIISHRHVACVPVTVQETDPCYAPHQPWSGIDIQTAAAVATGTTPCSRRRTKKKQKATYV